RGAQHRMAEHHRLAPHQPGASRRDQSPTATAMAGITQIGHPHRDHPRRWSHHPALTAGRLLDGREHLRHHLVSCVVLAETIERHPRLPGHEVVASNTSISYHGASPPSATAYRVDADPQLNVGIWLKSPALGVQDRHIRYALLTSMPSRQQ